MAMRKETRRASSPDNSLMSNTDDVTPERESPGMAESPWATPIISPSLSLRELAVFSPI